MIEYYVVYDEKKGEARHVLPERGLSASDLSDKTIEQAIMYLADLNVQFTEKWIAQDQWVQGEYMKSDGTRTDENRQVRFTSLEIGWQQVPYDDQYDTCLIGIRPISDDERAGLEAEKGRQLQYRKSQYERLKAEFEPDSD